MDESGVFEIVKTQVLAVLPDLEGQSLTYDAQLSDLGANSMDRVEVATFSQQELGIMVPSEKLAGVNNIGDLVRLLYATLKQSS